MNWRSDLVAGVITCASGVAMAGFGAFGLAIALVQRVMLQATPLPDDPRGAAVIESMRAIHGVWFVFLPLLVAGGLVFALSGWLVARGSQRARRVAQANAVAGYAWVIAYSVRCHQVMDAFAPVEMLPPPARAIFLGFTLVMGTLLGAAVPTGLLWVLSRARPTGQHAL
jgi:hypothetical protein